MSDRKSSQDSRTLLSIQADLNNAVVWMSDRKSPQDSRTLLSILADLSSAVVGMSDSKSLHGSRNLFSIQTDLNNAVVYMVLILSLFSNSSSIIATFMFYSFFSSLARS